MKRMVLGLSAIAVLVAILAITPGIIGNTGPSDEGRKATGPLWQNPDGSQSDSSQRRESSRMPAQAPVEARPRAERTPNARAEIDKRNAEIEKLTKMYAKKGMTPELARKIKELRAAQDGRMKTVPMTPELMAKLMKVRAAMQGKAGMPGKPPDGQFPERSLMDPRFAKAAGRISSREKLNLTPDAVMSVRVLDITQIERPRVIAEQAVANPGQSPISFEVWYNKQSISPKHRYAVQAIVADKGAVRWKSTAECRSIAAGQPTLVDVALQAVKQTQPPAPEVLVGDTQVAFEGENKPFLVDGGWMVPVAPVLKAAGVELEYSESDKQLTVQTGDSALKTKLPGRTVVLTDGSKKDLTRALELRNGAVYAPIQFLQMATGRRALFDRDSNTYVLVKM